MTSTDVNVAATYRKVGWRLIPFLVVGYFIAFLDRSNIGFANIQTARDLGFGPAVFGLGAGIFYLGYSLCELPSNLLLHRLGARKTMMRIMVLWGLIAGCFAFMRRPEHYYLLRFLLGCAEAGFFPGVLLYLTYWAPSTRRAGFTALFMSAMAVSGLIGGPLSGWIMSAANGLGGWAGWQWMFVIEAVPAILLGVSVNFFLVDRPGEATWLSAQEKALIARELAEEDAGGGLRRQRSFRRALKDKRLYALAGTSVALTAGIGGLAFWTPAILRDAGVVNVFNIGLMSSVPYAFALLAQHWVARRSDRLQERRWHVAACSVLAAVGWLSLPLAKEHPLLALLMLTLAAAGSFGATGPFWSMPPAILSGSAAAGGIAIVTTCGSLGAFVSPTIVGWVAQRTGNLDVALDLYVALFLFGATLLIAVIEPHPRAGRKRPEVCTPT